MKQDSLVLAKLLKKRLATPFSGVVGFRKNGEKLVLALRHAARDKVGVRVMGYPVEELEIDMSRELLDLGFAPSQATPDASGTPAQDGLQIPAGEYALYDFGAVQEGTELVPAALLYGLMLRFILLQQAGERERLLDELRCVCGPMARQSGTLWEHVEPRSSLNHGFAACVCALMQEPEPR